MREHYTWGDSENPCDGWHLLRTPLLSIIEERMPPGTEERRHRHAHAVQFFYVLAGSLTLEVEGATQTLTPGQGLEVTAGTAHQAINHGPDPVSFLVISQPPSHEDRIDA